MKSILFDLWQAQPLAGYKYHGGAEYIKSVYNHLINFFSEECSITVFFNPALFLDEWILESINTHKITIEPIKTKADIQKILDKTKYDVFYSGLPYMYGTLRIPTETVFFGTIHGLRSIEFPGDDFAYKYYASPWASIKSFIKNKIKEFYRKKNIELLKKGILNLDNIVCVSNHTKYAIKNFYPLLNKNIECLYTPQKVCLSPKIEKPIINDKYILLINCDRIEKNSYRAIVALEKLFSKRLLEKHKVVTIGKLPPKIIKTIVHKDKYISYDYVSTESLEGLYANCDIFLYPTLNEGFGMPPLEAMKYGKTCIVSAICSVPEVCGDAVYYINPYDINEIQTRILLAIENKISEKKITQQLQLISEKQNSDLHKLCQHITNAYKTFK